MFLPLPQCSIALAHGAAPDDSLKIAAATERSAPCGHDNYDSLTPLSGCSGGCTVCPFVLKPNSSCWYLPSGFFIQLVQPEDVERILRSVKLTTCLNLLLGYKVCQEGIGRVGREE